LRFVNPFYSNSLYDDDDDDDDDDDAGQKCRRNRSRKGNATVFEDSATDCRHRLLKAKFHYASWFEADSKLQVADQLRTS